MKKQIATIWDTKPGYYHCGRSRKQQRDLVVEGYTLFEARRYAKAMEHCLGHGLRKRIKEAVN